MASDVRVCPFCGEPPGPGLFCAACGRNLSAVERLPTRAAWASQQTSPDGSGAGRDADASPQAPAAEVAASVDARGPLLAGGGAEATAAFLAAMHAAGDPGTTTFPVARRSAFGRTPKVDGWVVRPVDRDDDVRPRRYAPGLVLGTDGAYRQLDSEVRGFGQRDFPRYHHTVGDQPLPVPAEPRLVEELEALLREHGAGVSGPGAGP